MNSTSDLIYIIGTPFNEKLPNISLDILENVYQKAFSDRVGLLYLDLHYKNNWPEKLKKLHEKLSNRRKETLSVISRLSQLLNKYCPNDYAIFKSLKPYPATPNDTDVIIFGNKIQFNSVINYLYENDYFFHEWAPMQTTLCDPRGRGKIGKGKKGGTYYIDIYSDISTDYFLYIDKKYLEPHVQTVEINDVKVRTTRKEIELGIILFHNVFPERTFQLEHFYMPLYLFNERDFNLGLFTQFAEEQRLVHAISANLTIIEYIHNKIFKLRPDAVRILLDRWGRNYSELERFKNRGKETPYLFSPKTFWMSFLHKIHDHSALKSLSTQAIHMLNPLFFIDVMRSLMNRFSERGTYHLE